MQRGGLFSLVLFSQVSPQCIFKSLGLPRGWWGRRAVPSHAGGSRGVPGGAEHGHPLAPSAAPRAPGARSPWPGSPSACGEGEDLLEPEELSSAHLWTRKPACGTALVLAALVPGAGLKDKCFQPLKKNIKGNNAQL